MEDNNNGISMNKIPVLFECSKFGFEDYISVSYGDLNKTHDAVITALRDGLPEEAHTVDIFNYILDQCKDTVTQKMQLKS